MKTRSLLMGLALLFGAVLCGAETVTSPQEQFDKASKFLEKGDYDQALPIYEDLLRQGFESPALYYNLGNLYFRKGERGRAVLWYERAHRLSPRDSDIEFNLDLARSHLKDADEDILEKIVRFFTPTELGWTFTTLMWIFFGVLGASIAGWIVSEGFSRIAIWFSGSLLLIVALWFGAGIAYARMADGIVVAPPGEVRHGPGNDFAVGFTVPEGSRVQVLARRPDWVQVGVPQQGLKGWMPAGDVEVISNDSSI